jgi:chemotaxis protein MotA
MSAALITTLYGSMIANWLLTPLANKLVRRHQEEMVIKEIMIEGTLSIQAGDNPRIVKENSPPSSRRGSGCPRR